MWPHIVDNSNVVHSCGDVMYCPFHLEYHHGQTRKMLCKAHILSLDLPNPKPWLAFCEAYFAKTDPRIRKLFNRIRETVEAAKAQEGKKQWERSRT